MYKKPCVIWYSGLVEVRRAEAIPSVFCDAINTADGNKQADGRKTCSTAETEHADHFVETCSNSFSKSGL